jgi:pyruvate formate lyase activating enzyme
MQRSSDGFDKISLGALESGFSAIVYLRACSFAHLSFIPIRGAMSEETTTGNTKSGGEEIRKDSGLVPEGASGSILNSEECPANNGKTGLIFDIQGHSVHDGPGTRTLIFLSGCPLRCTWCANPEGLKHRQRLMHKEQFCKECPRRCIAACPHGAVSAVEDGPALVSFDRSKCESCQSRECLDVCYMGALQLSGKYYTVDEVMAILNRDRYYWGQKGGVSLSGGDPLMQGKFVVELLRRCNDAYINVCIETTANISRRTLKAVAPFVQWFFIDVKNMDSKRHKEFTGVGNETILENIRWLAGSGWEGRILLRMPVIAGFNDSIENARATAAFMKSCGLNEINLLPFHRLGASKYRQLGLEYQYDDQPACNPEDLKPLAEIYEAQGLKCYIGSNTPF